MTGSTGNTVAYIYMGNMNEKLRLTYPDGQETTYTYNEKGQLTTLTAPGGAITYAYDPLGRLREKTFPNGITTQYTYNKAGMLETIRHTGNGFQEQYTYKYDLSGNKTETHRQRQDTDQDNGTFTYTYDRRGNLTTVTAGEQLLKTFTFDAANHMTAALQIKDGVEKTARYTYDALGNRTGQDTYTRETGTPAPAIDHKAPQDPEQHIRYTLDLTRQYHNLLLTQDTATGKKQTFHWDANVAAMQETGQNSYYLQDDLGSPMLLTDEQGQIRESYAYDEYGQALRHTPEDQLQPFGYTGYQMETTSGLYFAQARRYDAAAGRFTSEDKIPGLTTLPHTMNRYTYCWNQPLEHVDLNGRFPLGVVKFIEKLMNYALGKYTELADNLSKIEEKQIAEYTAAVYLVNRDGALGQGHAALLLVREDGQAEFYSYAGRVNPGAVTIGCEGYLSTHLDEDGNPATVSVEKFTTERGVFADRVDSKNENINKRDEYSNGVYIPITNDEGIAMHKMAMIIRYVPGRYNLWKHNCGQVAQIILRAGGKDFAATQFAWWNTRPNSVYDNIVEEIERGDRPGWRHGAIEDLRLSESFGENSCVGGE